MILRANKACEIKFDGPEFNEVSELAMDLLKKLLKAKPEDRISAEESLSHPWIKQEGEDRNLKTAVENIKSYEVDFVYNVRQK